MRRERLEIGWYAVRPFLIYIVLFITIRSVLYRLLESVLLAASADMTACAPASERRTAGDHGHQGKKRRRMDRTQKRQPSSDGSASIRHHMPVRFFKSCTGRFRSPKCRLYASGCPALCGCCLRFSDSLCGRARLQGDRMAPAPKGFLPGRSGSHLIAHFRRGPRRSPAGHLCIYNGNGLRDEF